MIGFGSGPRSRKPSRRTLVGVAIAIVLVLAVGGWRMTRAPAATSMDGMNKDGAVPPLVTVVVPAMGNVATTVSLTGLISARNDMPIGNEGDVVLRHTMSAPHQWRKAASVERWQPTKTSDQSGTRAEAWRFATGWRGYCRRK